MNRPAALALLCTLVAIGFAFQQRMLRRQSEVERQQMAQERSRLLGEATNLKQRLEIAHQRLVQSELQAASLKDDFSQIFSKTNSLPSTTAPQSGFVVGVPRRGGVPSLRLASPTKALDTTYHALYRELKFSAEQIGQFKTVMKEAATSFEDLDRQARQKRVSPMDRTMQPMYAEVDRDLRAKVHAHFGESAVPVIERFIETLSLREAVTQVSAELLYTETPLTETQASRLVDIMQKHMRDPAGRLNPTFADAKAMIADAVEVLSAPQVKIWNEFIEDMGKTSFGQLNRPRR